jgi:hypothetical protein
MIVFVIFYRLVCPGSGREMQRGMSVFLKNQMKRSTRPFHWMLGKEKICKKILANW